MSNASFFKKMSSLFTAFSSKKYRINPAAQALSPQQQTALWIGAINSEQISAYINSYETGLDQDTLADALEEYWEITDSASAADTLFSLQEKGHRYYYNFLLPIFLNESPSTWQQKVIDYLVNNNSYESKDEAEYDIMKSLSLLENLQETYRTLEDDINGNYLAADYQRGIIAWDLGRMVVVGRMCYDRKLIDKAALEGILDTAYKAIHGAFADWREMAKSYIIGRAFWSGANMSLDGIIGIAEDLMRDSDSPWTQYRLS